MGRRARIAVLAGDGIGPEVTAAAVAALKAVAARFGHTFVFSDWLVGAHALREKGMPLPEDTLAACRDADAVLLGAVGDPAYELAPFDQRPEYGLLQLRKSLGVYANIRPARLYRALADAGPLKPEIARGLDLVVVRELTGGLYFGTPRSVDLAAGTAVNTLPYTRAEIERIAGDGVPPGGDAPEQGHLRRQVERPRDLPALARRDDGSRPAASGRDAGAPVRGRLRDEPRALSRPPSTSS